MKGATGIYYSQSASGGKTFEVRFYDSDGKRRYEAVGPRLDQAKARLAEVTGAKVRGERIVPVGMTFAQAVDGWREVRQIKPRTIDSYETSLRVYALPRFGRERVRDIGTIEVRAWLNTLRRHDGKPGELASGTKAAVLTALSAVLDHAVEAGALNVNPARQLGRHKPRQESRGKRILTRDEEARLIAYSGGSPWLAPILRTALLSALRLGELAGLMWRDVDFTNNKLHVRRTITKGNEGTPKGGKAATIDLLPELRALLIEVRAESPARGEDDFVFVSKFGRPRIDRNIQRAFSKAAKLAGIGDGPDGERFTFHSLRHTAISRLANNRELPMPWVQAFARHSNLATTLAYVHLIDDHANVVAAARALSG